MSPQLQQRIQDAAEEIVSAVDGCLMRTPKLNKTKAVLSKLVSDIEKELTPETTPATPAN